MNLKSFRRGRGGQGGHEPRARIRTRELRVLELDIQGMSQHDIAAEVGVSQAAVSKILKRVSLRLYGEQLETLDRQKVRHTLRLESLFREAMRAWEASKADATRKRQRKSEGGSGGSGATVAELVVENQHGDPRYLEQARKALADHRKLWGLDAPQQVDLRTPRNPFDDLSEEALREELQRQVGLLDQATVPLIDVTPLPSPPIAGEEVPHGETA